jgi:outer membrane receptor protein involved in Fe transport
MIAIILALALAVQQQAVNGVVTDATGAPMAGVIVTVTTDTTRETAMTSADGTWTSRLPDGARVVGVRVEAPGFARIDRVVPLPAETVRFELRPQGIAEQVTVSGESAAARLAIDSSVTSIDRSTIAASPQMKLDDQLRLVPGFSLFRRTSSAVANPTTQGVTLRGLSASGASRTLVIADDLPLNDPFGGWVYWDRVPLASLQRVDVVRGASGDIHGNDALGGVIRLTTRTNRGAEAWLDGGNRGTARASAYAALSQARWMAGAAAESATTDGYVVVAPEVRGPADVPADSRATSGTAWAGGNAGSFQGTVRGGYFDESRGNGTPAQVNATVTRWSGGNAHGIVGGGLWEARGDLATTDYRQTFSAVNTGRATERLTNLQWVGSSGGGGAVSWFRQAGRAQGLIAASSRLARATLDEASFSLAGVESAIARTRGRQRSEGLVAQGRYDFSRRLSIDAGARAESWHVTKLDSANATHTLHFFQPRAGLSFRIDDSKTVRASWLTGFRVPTMNELYRSFRVGNTTTAANADLTPEKSSGPEIAFTMAQDRWTGRAIFYASRLKGAIYNRTLSSTATLIQRQRSNGDARAMGTELEVEWRAARALTLTSAWAINDSKFTSGELDGKRVPQVPRTGGSIGVRTTFRMFSAAANIRVIGAQFDDDRNDFNLKAGSLADARAGWRWSRRLELFGAIENAFDEELDTGRTPLRTVGGSRMGRAGLIVRF